ncbi:MAG: hypothetical protein NVS2B7_07040 [Herpetosiphon sp.]
MLWFRRTMSALAVLAMLVSARPASVNAYASCNCTAYAHYRRQDLPMNLGDAWMWGYRAKNQGFPVDSYPQVGDVMVLQPGVQGASWDYGHVAYVVAVYDDYSFAVREMNGGDSSCGVYRDEFHVGRGVKFIHHKYQRSSYSASSARSYRSAYHRQRAQ